MSSNCQEEIQRVNDLLMQNFLEATKKQYPNKPLPCIPMPLREKEGCSETSSVAGVASLAPSTSRTIEPELSHVDTMSCECRACVLKAYVHMDQYPDESPCDCEVCATGEEPHEPSPIKPWVFEKKEGSKILIHKDGHFVEVTVDKDGKYKESNGGYVTYTPDGWVSDENVDEQKDVSEAYHQRALEETMGDQSKKQSICDLCEEEVVVGGFDHRKCQGIIPYDCDECHDYYTDHRPCQGMTRSEIGYEDYLNGKEWLYR